MNVPAILPTLVARLRAFPWLSMAGLTLALFAQSMLEPPARPLPAFIIYLSALGFIVWAILQGEWSLAHQMEIGHQGDLRRPHMLPLMLSMGSLTAAFFLFGGNRFTLLNLTLWLLGLTLLLFSLRAPHHQEFPKSRLDWEWLVLLAAVMMFSAFFRFYRLEGVPAEPFSDHAEKILDVVDVSRGETSIFFERNTGREAIQIYWTWLVAKVLGTGYSFMSLKIGTALFGIFTLPFVFLLGRELGNPLVGILALLIFGMAYWPNVISRIGLRFPLYPLFVAPTLFFLIRGLRTGSQNDFLLCGLCLGFGLHGYSPFRIMPILVAGTVGLYVLHQKQKRSRHLAIWGLIIVTVVSLAVFLPLLRYWLENPVEFGFRAWSRLGFGGRQVSGEGWIVFLSNLLKGLLMFNWDDGGIWVNSIPHRPALDVVTAVLFVIGVLLLISRYLRRHDWRDVFLLASIPMLLMPSVLSLAYPLENPALNRAGGAAVVVAIVSAGALTGLLAGFGRPAGMDGRAEAHGRIQPIIGIGIAAILLSASALQNYYLVFRKFDKNYRLTVWNASEMAGVIQDHGNLDSAWIVPFSQWVDTRLPAMLLGNPTYDQALWPDEFAETVGLKGPKLFIFSVQDLETENALNQIYPHGSISRYTSVNIGKDFMIFQVED